MKTIYSFLPAGGIVAGLTLTMTACSNDPSPNNTDSTAGDLRIALVKANHKGLRPVTIIGAEIDPLQSHGQALRDAPRSAGVGTGYRLYNRVTHEFFGMDAIVPDAKDAENYAAEALRKLFK